MKTTRDKYDIVILGAGCSGMLLSFFLSNQKTKHKKKIYCGFNHELSSSILFVKNFLKKKKYDLDDGDKSKFSYEEWNQEYGKFNDRINSKALIEKRKRTSKPNGK